MNNTIETTPSSTSATISPTSEGRSSFSAFVVNLFAGGVSGIAAKTAAAPLDRIKLLMQTQKINRAITKPYTSSWNCAVRVYAEEGLSSFWRGNLANVYRYFPSQALNFAFKDQFKVEKERTKNTYSFKDKGKNYTLTISTEMLKDDGTTIENEDK